MRKRGEARWWSNRFLGHLPVAGHNPARPAGDVQLFRGSAPLRCEQDYSGRSPLCTRTMEDCWCVGDCLLCVSHAVLKPELVKYIYGIHLVMVQSVGAAHPLAGRQRAEPLRACGRSDPLTAKSGDRQQPMKSAELGTTSSSRTKSIDSCMPDTF